MTLLLRSCGYCRKYLLVFMSSSAYPHTRACVHSFVSPDLWCSQTLSQCLWEALLAISVWIIDIVFWWRCMQANWGQDVRGLRWFFPVRLQRWKGPDINSKCLDWVSNAAKRGNLQTLNQTSSSVNQTSSSIKPTSTSHPEDAGFTHTV